MQIDMVKSLNTEEALETISMSNIVSSADKPPQMAELYSLPSISFVIATYNSAVTLGSCLKSIRDQNYPASKIEIIIVDGGSRDETFDVCRRYNVDKILSNPFRVEEKGIAIGVRYARNEILGSVDADNVLPTRDWLLKVIAPFENEDVVESEPLSYSSRKEDSAVTRYVGLIGADDPIALYTGFYDRFCYFRGRWTDMPFTVVRQSCDYTIVHLDEKYIPPIGANGAFFRAEALKNIEYDPFNHVDLIYKLVKAGYYGFAKVNIGILHIQDNKIRTFISKKRRRVVRQLKNELSPAYDFKTTPIFKRNFPKFVFSSLFVFPLLLDIRKGYEEKPDLSWFLHLIVCPFTFWIYATETIKWLVDSKIGGNR